MISFINQDDFISFRHHIYGKDKGEVVDNGHTYTPDVLNDVAIDWSKMFPKTDNLLNMPNLMVLPNTGCQQSIHNFTIMRLFKKEINMLCNDFAYI